MAAKERELWDPVWPLAMGPWAIDMVSLPLKDGRLPHSDVITKGLGRDKARLTRLAMRLLGARMDAFFRASGPDKRNPRTV